MQLKPEPKPKPKLKLELEFKVKTEVHIQICIVVVLFWRLVRADSLWFLLLLTVSWFLLLLLLVWTGLSIIGRAEFRTRNTLGNHKGSKSKHPFSLSPVPSLHSPKANYDSISPSPSPSTSHTKSHQFPVCIQFIQVFLLFVLFFLCSSSVEIYEMGGKFCYSKTIVQKK